jgi:hypothetical protein
MKKMQMLASLMGRIGRFHSRAANGKEKLWKVWWIAGIPLGWATSLLVIIADEMRHVGFHGTGNFLDLVRLLIYFAWARLAWRCSHSVARPVWTAVAQTTLAAGFLFMAMF